MQPQLGVPDGAHWCLKLTVPLITDAQPRVGPEQRAPPPRLSPFEYRYLTEFQSHEPEFDYLKSLEIEEKINQVRRPLRAVDWWPALLGFSSCCRVWPDWVYEV